MFWKTWLHKLSICVDFKFYSPLPVLQLRKWRLRMNKWVLENHLIIKLYLPILNPLLYLQWNTVIEINYPGSFMSIWWTSSLNPFISIFLFICSLANSKPKIIVTKIGHHVCCDYLGQCATHLTIIKCYGNEMLLMMMMNMTAVIVMIGKIIMKCYVMVKFLHY